MGSDYHFISNPTHSPCYDMLTATADELFTRRAKFNSEVVLNGLKLPRKLFPQLRGFTRHKTLAATELAALGVRTKKCPFCAKDMTRSDFKLIDHPDEMPSFRAQASLGSCESCLHWEHVEFRDETYDVRASLYSKYTLTIASSKTREFDTVAPEGTLNEIAQWFRRHPNLYNSVNPIYLEKLVAEIFRASGEYTEVKHVGRPDDGGIDVILVESNQSTWLVQVKRREHPASVEPVSTIRNLLGTLILNGTDRGIVVSTADHFSFRAREAVDVAAQRDYTVRLVDRGAFDALLSGCLPKAPWKEVIASINSNRAQWFGESDELPYREAEWRISDNTSRLDHDPNQISLF